ncbi:hypothetical protein HDU89_005751 [Geranomyces variabilis]|nr:hypothetical protein HDU89_005751 [Geranomyces variabilis]
MVATDGTARIEDGKGKLPPAGTVRPVPPLPATQIPAHALRVGIRGALLAFAIRSGIAFLIRLVMVFKRKTTLREAIVHVLTAKAHRSFAYFIGSFGAIWKGVDNTLRLIRKKDDKLNGFVAGACAGLALGFEERGRRINIAQQILVRGLRCVFHGMRTREIFHLPHSESLLFALGSAQIMYAYVQHPTTIPHSFYKFIVKSGPIPESILRLVRMVTRNQPFDPAAAVEAVTKAHGTAHAIATAAALGTHPVITPCEVLHPWTQNCHRQTAWAFAKTFRIIIPVYAALNLVPMMLLKMKSFIRRPIPLTKHALFNAGRSSVFLATFVSSYMFFACRYRDLVKANIIPRDSRYAYWFFGLLAGGSIFIEQRSRRSDLAIYVLPRAIESLYTVMRHRKLAPRIKYFEILMFSVGTGCIISFFQTEPSAVSGVLQRIIRRFEIAIEDKKVDDESDDESEAAPPKVAWAK